MTATKGVLWLEAQYKRNKYCQGPPSAIYLFQTASPLDADYDPTSDNPYLSDIFTKLFEYLPYPFSTCGNCNVELPISSFCCLSSLDLTLSSNYLSGTDILVTETGDMDSTIQINSPNGASGHSYCLLSAMSSLDNSTSFLFNFNTTMFLNNDECINSNINMSATCSQSGLLTLYADSDCAIAETSIQLDKTMSPPYLSETWGLYTGKMFTFTAAHQSHGWTTFQPGGLLVPTFENSTEVFVLVGYILSLLQLLVCTYYSFVRWSKRQTFVDLVAVAQFVVWMIAVVVRMTIDYTLFTCSTDPNTICPSLDWLLLFNFILSYIARYLCVFIASTTLYRVANIQPFTQNVTNASIFFLFVLLGFGNLLDYILRLIFAYQTSIEVKKNPIFYLFVPRSFWIAWSTAASYWTVFMFFWNIIPMNIALIQLAQRRKNLSFEKTVQEIIKMDTDMQIRILNALHILIVIAYTVLTVFRDNTTILGNDRSALAFGGVFLWLLATHCMVNFFLTEAVKGILVKISGYKSTKKNSVKPFSKKLNWRSIIGNPSQKGGNLGKLRMPTKTTEVSEANPASLAPTTPIIPDPSS